MTIPDDTKHHTFSVPVNLSRKSIMGNGKAQQANMGSFMAFPELMIKLKIVSNPSRMRIIISTRTALIKISNCNKKGLDYSIFIAILKKNGLIKTLTANRFCKMLGMTITSNPI